MAKDTPLSVIFTFTAEEVENPYIELLYDALRDTGVSVIEGNRPILFPLTRNVLTHPNGDVLHLDWIYGFYMTNGLTRYKVINDLITCVRTIFFLLDLFLASILPTAIVWTVHNKHHHERKYPRTERIVNEFAFWVVDGVSVKCENACDILDEVYINATPEKMFVVPDGNYITAYNNEISKSEARSALGVDKNTFVYLYFGLIREYKGVPDLIRAYDQLDMSNTELWIVGNPSSEEYERELNDHLDTVPNSNARFEFVESEDVQYFLNAADALVLPYRDILNSGSVHLGLSFAVPIVTPRLGCVPATVPTENEFLYDPNAAESLQQELKHVYEHPDLGQVGEANYQRALSQSWDNTTSQLVSVYESVT